MSPAPKTTVVADSKPRRTTEVRPPDVALDELFDTFEANRDELNPLRIDTDMSREQMEQMLLALSEVIDRAEAAFLAVIATDCQWKLHTFRELSEITGRSVPTIHRWNSAVKTDMRRILSAYGYLKHTGDKKPRS